MPLLSQQHPHVYCTACWFPSKAMHNQRPAFHRIVFDSSTAHAGLHQSILRGFIPAISLCTALLGCHLAYQLLGCACRCLWLLPDAPCTEARTARCSAASGRPGLGTAGASQPRWLKVCTPAPATSDLHQATRESAVLLPYTQGFLVYYRKCALTVAVMQHSKAPGDMASSTLLLSHSLR